MEIFNIGVYSYYFFSSPTMKVKYQVVCILIFAIFNMYWRLRIFC